MLPRFADALKGSQACLPGGPHPLPGWVPPHSHPSPLARKKKILFQALYPVLTVSNPDSVPALAQQNTTSFAGRPRFRWGQTPNLRKEENGRNQLWIPTVPGGVKDSSPATALNDQLAKEAPRACTCKASYNQWKVAVNDTATARLGQGNAPTPKCSECPR